MRPPFRRLSADDQSSGEEDRAQRQRLHARRPSSIVAALGLTRFLPFIHGVILPSGKGSVMQVEMRMHPAARRFLLAWLGAVILCFLLFTFVMPSGDTFSTLLVRVIPFFMLAFGIFITIIGFYPEAKIAQEFLRDTLRASELDPRE